MALVEKYINGKSRSMVIKYKKNLFLSLIILISFISADEEKSIYIPSIKIYENSTVLRLSSFSDTNDFRRLGNYVYELDRGELFMKLNNSIATSQAGTSLLKNNLKIFQYDNGPMKITDGTLIIKFYSNEFNNFLSTHKILLLEEKQDRNIGIYKAQSYDDLNTQIKNISNEPSVKYVELNILNPYILGQ